MSVLESTCSVGHLLNESCQTGSGEEFYYPDDQEKELLCWRLRADFDGNLCQSHRKIYLTLFSINQKYCANPLGQHKGKLPTKGLREVSLRKCFQYKHLSLIPGSKLCTNCRKGIQADAMLVRVTPYEEHGSMSDPEEQDDNDEFESFAADIGIINSSLSGIGESPIQKKRLIESKTYSEQKVEKITGAIRKKLKMGVKQIQESNENEMAKSKIELDEILNQLKEKFHSSVGRAEKLQVLTVLPKSWSTRRISTEFECSDYMARRVKKLVAEKGILSTPNPKPGHAIHNDVVQLVRDFYASAEVSRSMPGKKDCISMRVNGVKERIQKRLILCTLKEAYLKFKEENQVSVGFSKFCEFRPKNVVLPGDSGAHSVCVCTIHQDEKLMLENSGIFQLPEFRSLVGDGFDGKVSYQHLLAKLTCNPPLPHCFLGNCKNCGKTEILKTELAEIFEQLDVEEITFNSWISVDRTSLETLTKSTCDFINYLLESLLKLKRHDFIARQQSAYLKEAKEKLKPHEAIILGDFAETTLLLCRMLYKASIGIIAKPPFIRL